MRLINQSKNIVLAEDVFVARTLLSRIRGLLGRKNFPSGQAIILDPCNSVHTFFMHFSIDVVFVDKNYRVIKVLSDLKPNKISCIYWHAHKAIELPAGRLNLTNIQPQDQLQLLD